MDQRQRKNRKTQQVQESPIQPASATTSVVEPRNDKKLFIVSNSTTKSKTSLDTVNNDKNKATFNIPKSVDVLNINESPVSVNEKFSKREIVSNWSKYDNDNNSSSSNDNEQLTAADFQKLLQTPVSIGDHFRFDSEKKWDETLTMSKYFNINLNDLTENLLSIPFYQRLDYPIEMFTKQEIQSMNKKSNQYVQSKGLPDKMIQLLMSNVDEVPIRIPDVIPENRSNTTDNDIVEVKPIDNDIEIQIIQPIVTEKVIARTSSEDKSLETPDNVEIVSSNKPIVFESNIQQVNTEIVNEKESPEKNHSDDELDNLFEKLDTTKIDHKIDVKLVKPIPIVKENAIVKNKKISGTNKKVVGETKEEIEQWLDDILNE